MSAKLDAACEQIAKLTGKHDFSPEIKANGFRSFLKIVDKYRENVANNNERDAAEKEKILKLLEDVADLLIKTNDREHDNFGTSTELDKEIFAASFALCPPPTPMGGMGGPCDPFWYDSEIRQAFAKLMQGFAELMKNNDPQGMLDHVASLDYVQDLKMVKVPRKSEWVIEVSDKGSSVSRSDFRIQDMLDCLIMKPKENRHPESIYFMTHGGAFMFGSPAICAEKFAKICDKVGVITVLPKFSLAPVHRYPAGLQDILDIYSFFASDSPLVKNLIGFHPNQIVVDGESSGGNQTASLIFALQMIREAGGSVQLPIGVHMTYPCPTPSIVAFPSTLIQNLDPLVTGNGMAGMIGLYPKTDPLLEPGWQASPQLEQAMQILQSRSEDPLFNNLAWKNWSSLKEIPLIVLVAEFDCLMDPGIQVAKRWQGPVKVRVAENLPHGFLYMKSESCLLQEQILIDDISSLLKGKV